MDTITIRYGAGLRTLTMGGHTYDLNAANRQEFNILRKSLARRFNDIRRNDK